MHKAMLAAYRRMLDPSFSGSVLEIGATPDDNLLFLLPKAKRTGLNLERFECNGFTIDGGDAHAMPYPDSSFDMVICNAVLEHVAEPLTIMAEIKRVTAPGGLIVIGVPGYRRLGIERVNGKLKKLLPRFLHNPFLVWTLVYQRHDEPVDYWRPSMACVRDVFLKGLTDVTVESVMLPPRIIGTGRKP